MLGKCFSGCNTVSQSIQYTVDTWFYRVSHTVLWGFTPCQAVLSASQCNFVQRNLDNKKLRITFCTRCNTIQPLRRHWAISLGLDLRTALQSRRDVWGRGRCRLYEQFLFSLLFFRFTLDGLVKKREGLWGMRFEILATLAHSRSQRPRSFWSAPGIETKPECPRFTDLLSNMTNLIG